MKITSALRRKSRLAGIGLLAFVPVAMLGCNNAPTAGPGDDANASEPLSFDGSINGKAFDSQSTRGDTDETASGQAVPPEFDTDNTVVQFQDMNGEPLKGPNGNPLPPVPVNADGAFEADDLPVGSDFIVCTDIGDDDDCDIESCVNVPADGPNDDSGRLEDLRVDPLTTAVLAKLRDLMAQRDIRPEDLPFSPAAVVGRIVAAYTNLFEETGVDQSILLDDIESLTIEQVAEFFDEFIPPIAQAGMLMAEGSLDTAVATDVEDVAFGAAKVFLRAGFPLIDNPGGLDLTPLADLEGVEVTSLSALFERPEDPFAPDAGVDIPPDLLNALPPELVEQIPPDFNGDISTLSPEVIDALIELDPALADVLSGDAPTAAEDDMTVYINKHTEPDRNFSDEEGDRGPSGPIMNDHLLVAMARLQMSGATITVGELHDLLTDLDTGLGARLTYFIFDPNFFGPPLMVFETADGTGLALDESRIFAGFGEEGLDTVDFDSFEEFEARLRAKLAELLADTVAPSFDRIFRVLSDERIGSVDELARALRSARSHLPFGRSGPSTFFVVADGDPFAPDAGAVSAVTVDADVTPDGRVNSISFNPDGTGKFYLSFTQGTEGEGFVELIVRETGIHLHGEREPVRVSMFNSDIFQPYDGTPFADLVASTGTFYPGTNVTVVRSDFEPTAIEPAPEPTDPIDPNLSDNTDGSTTTDEPLPASSDVDSGPNDQIFVLATHIGRDAEPVRVDFDFATGTATFNPGGRNLLMFLPDSHETGLFALFNEDTGRPASPDDPTNFFTGPADRPEDYDSFYNEAGGFEDYENVEDVDGFVDDVFLDDGTVVLPPPDEDFSEPPPDEEPISPAEFAGLVDEFGHILVAVDDIVDGAARRDEFTRVFGVDVPNPHYDADGDPYFDDVDADGVQDDNEPTAPFRPVLFDRTDWRSTDIRLYYRRADNGQAVLFDNVAFESPTPQTLDGVELVPRDWRPRRNAFRFGRPNTTLNLLAGFAPPAFFNGTNRFNEETRVDIFGALSLINLVMDQVFNVEARVDVDGLGPLPARDMLIDAQMFIAPVGDPFVLILDGFRERLDVDDATAPRRP